MEMIPPKPAKSDNVKRRWPLVKPIDSMHLGP